MNIFGLIFRPAAGFLTFLIVLFFAYAVVPVANYIFFNGDVYYFKLFFLTLIASIGMIVGFYTSIVDSRFALNSPRINISYNSFQKIIWTLFIVLVVVSLVTAPSVPLISSLRGASAEALSQERGDFLKSRTGAWIILLYASTFFLNTFIPYSIICMYKVGSKYRYLAAVFFFMFCISFLQKSLFMNLILPLIAYFSISGKLTYKMSLSVVLFTVVVLVGGVYVSSGEDVQTALVGSDDFMSATYIPESPMEYFLWRSVAVPIFTAADTLNVFDKIFEENIFWGATSNFLASIIGADRINIERYVFEYQFGGWNEIANSNAVFVTDAYVNFGYFGVLFFSIFIGQIFRWFEISNDIAFKSLWPVFAFVIFSASLIGMLFSNGFLYMIFHALFVRINVGKSN